jgi:hypothetical protein
VQLDSIDDILMEGVYPREEEVISFSIHGCGILDRRLFRLFKPQDNYAQINDRNGMATVG